MKFATFALLSSAVSAADPTIGTACTATATLDAACTGDGERCMDWQGTDVASALRCGLQTDCGKTDYVFATKTYTLMCTGLSGTACPTGNAACDAKGGFKCADWTPAGEGKTATNKCAHSSECGKTVDSNSVVCLGMVGDVCTNNAACDPVMALKCADNYNKVTFKFGGAAKCAKGDACGKDVDPAVNNTINLCYGEAGTKCDNKTACAVPDGAADNLTLACGYIAPKVDNATNVTTMCVDSTQCATGDATSTTIKYFGADVTLVCGSVRTALAMGAAMISTYYAM